VKRLFVLGSVCLSGLLQAQGVSVVSGVVRDESGAPIREALVSIDPDSLSLRARTSADGQYRVFAVPRGQFEVRVVRIGYRPLSQVLDVNAEAVTFDVTLRAVPIQLDEVTVRVARPGLYGRVMSRGIELLPHEPTPVRAANIQVLNEPFQVKSGADGRFSIPQLPVGPHALMVTIDKYVSRLVPITVPPEGGVEITITLDSLYATYQFRDDAIKREISKRQRDAVNPATFVSAHELDSDAKDLRDALRFAPSTLSRGISFMDLTVPSGEEPSARRGERTVVRSARQVIYIDGVVTTLKLQDLKLQEMSVAGIEVYPAGSLKAPLSTPGTGGSLGSIEYGTLFSSGSNQVMLIMIWTTRRR
jgi:hypothetical protein